MTSKEQFVELIKERGFSSTRKFADYVGVDHSNILTNFNGKFNISFFRMLRFANALCVPLEVILNIFYPDEMEENKFIVNEGQFLRTSEDGVAYDYATMVRECKDMKEWDGDMDSDEWWMKYGFTRLGNAS